MCGIARKVLHVCGCVCVGVFYTWVIALTLCYSLFAIVPNIFSINFLNLFPFFFFAGKLRLKTSERKYKIGIGLDY